MNVKCGFSINVAWMFSKTFPVLLGVGSKLYIGISYILGIGI